MPKTTKVTRATKLTKAKGAAKATRATKATKVILNSSHLSRDLDLSGAFVLFLVTHLHTSFKYCKMQVKFKKKLNKSFKRVESYTGRYQAG